MATRQLVLATHNRNKTKELLPFLDDLGVALLTLDDFPTIGDIPENEPTLEGNALVKAHAVFDQTGLPSLADDTGLEVYYLNGAPGVYSARYAGENATYSDNVRKLLRAMQGVPERRRGARFRCVLSFVAPGLDEGMSVDGICRGEILEIQRGNGGFGYDPVFRPLGFAETFAEIPLEEKNRLSHRGKALVAMRPILREYFGKS
jgi:XTP/dITP diphosphohydrolase